MSENPPTPYRSALERAKAAALEEIARKQAGAQTSNGSEGMGQDIPFSSAGRRNENGGAIARLRAQLGEIETQMNASGPLIKAQLACQKMAIQREIAKLEHSKGIDIER